MPSVFYFAYGSNMDSATLKGRRGIHCIRATPALARGRRLAIDKPSLLGNDEAMATLVAETASEAWGVLFEITAKDLEHLELTEGVRIGHYDRVPLVVETTPSWSGTGASTNAVTLTSETRDPSVRPSSRYMGLLLSGAAEHGLPESWIEGLRCIDTVEESPEHAALQQARYAAMRKPGC